MAHKAGFTEKRHRALSIGGSLAIVVGVTLGMIGIAGAEDLGGQETAPEEVATTAPPTTAPPTTAPPTTVPPTTVAPTTLSVQSDDGPVGTQDHTTFPTYTNCSSSTNEWHSDSRADPGGACTGGNPSTGGPTPTLARCVSSFGSGVTTVYDSQSAGGTGDANVTGAITAHAGGGTQVNVTAAAGVTIHGVFVKAGDAYNAYIGNEPNMIGPLVGNWDPGDNQPSPNFADISHYVVCYSGTAQAATGGLDVDKVVSGTPPGGTTFTVTVDCEADDTGDGTLVFDAAGTLTTAGTIDTLPITGLPVGTSCTVTEPDNGGADSVVITGSPAVIAADVTSQVTVTNTFLEPDTGGLNVTKTVEGPVPGGTTFTVDVDCEPDDTGDGTLVFDETGTLTNAGTIDTLPITGLPVGTSCTVTEPEDGGATNVVITGSAAVIAADTISQVSVTNTFIEVGGDLTVRLDVDKEVVGVAPPDGTEFTVNVSCTGAATVNENLVFTYPEGLGVQSIIEQIPSDGQLDCTVTETDPGGTTLVGYKIDGGATQGGAPTIQLDINRPSAAVTVVNDPGVEVAGVAVGQVAFTGSSRTEILLASAALLIAIGTAIWLLSRQRRRPSLLG